MYKVEETGISVIPFLTPWTVLRGLELNGIIFCEIQGKGQWPEDDELRINL